MLLGTEHKLLLLLLLPLLLLLLLLRLLLLLLLLLGPRVDRQLWRSDRQHTLIPRLLQLLAQLLFAEYAAQMVGGVAMNQGEVIRPADRLTPFRLELGIGDEPVVLYAGNVGFSQSLGLVLEAARRSGLAQITFAAQRPAGSRP